MAEHAPPTHRIALGVEYDGRGFNGWQRQRHSRGVQQAVEEALAAVADHPVQVHCAGRTDAGVHALGQVIHFDTTAERDPRGWLLGGNSNLDAGIAFTWAQPVDAGFHARFTAQARRYRYVILNRPSRPGLFGGRVSWIREPLDAGAMHAAGQHLLGEHDFSSFRAQGCQSRSPVRRVIEVRVGRSGEYVVLEIEANAFVHHMVRNVAGVLIEIGRGERPGAWAGEVLEARDRTRAGVTAPAEGLYLAAVRYPEPYRFPAPVQAPLLP